jgi:hypothetical protein
LCDTRPRFSKNVFEKLIGRRRVGVIDGVGASTVDEWLGSGVIRLT